MSINPDVDPDAAVREGGVIEAAKKLWEMLAVQREEAERAESWMKVSDEESELQHISLPNEATPDARNLRKKAPTPWLGLATTVVVQQLYAEGYRDEDTAKAAKREDPDAKPPESKGWQQWQQNGMDRRQTPLYRGAVGHGQAFLLTVPGKSRLTKKKMVSMRGYSALSMVASYEDPANDEWPYDALYVTDFGESKRNEVFVVDDQFIHELREDGGKFEYIRQVTRHGVGVTPVVRYCNQLDLDGNVTGEVTPFIPMASRLDQDTFDRLIVQRYGAWRVRWATGLSKPKDPADQTAASLAMRVQDLLVNESVEGKFGTLEPTELAGYIAAREADIRDLAAVTQIPPQYLLGSVSNMSAEALAASEAMLTRKVEERKHSFGESHEQNLRLAAHIMGDTAAAEDYSSSIRWRDVESRSMAQVADALGKLATMLELPWEALVDRIPGWTDDDTALVRELKKEQAEQEREDAEALMSAMPAPAAKTAAPTATKQAQATKRPAA